MEVFQITKPEHVNKTFRIPKKILQELEKIAQEQGISLNRLVIRCCEYALGELKQES